MPDSFLSTYKIETKSVIVLFGNGYIINGAVASEKIRSGVGGAYIFLDYFYGKCETFSVNSIFPLQKVHRRIPIQ